jgi:hypothetical protein
MSGEDENDNGVKTDEETHGGRENENGFETEKELRGGRDSESKERRTSSEHDELTGFPTERET